MDKNFEDVINVLNSSGLFYWVSHGSLLGLIRDGKLIDWDPDIDISMWDSPLIKEQVFLIMTKNGFLCSDYCGSYDCISFSRSEEGRDIDFNFYKKIEVCGESMCYSEWPVARNKFMSIILLIADYQRFSSKLKIEGKPIKCLSFFFKIIQNIFQEFGFIYKSMGYTIPMNFLTKFTVWNYNSLKFTIPHNYSEILECLYGKSWTTPQKDFEWTKDSKATIELRSKR
jgi:hypothetical protein